MRRLGFCYKCGEYKIVRDHHAFGYETDETVPYCVDCDRKAHNKARKEGRCNLSSEETSRKSKNSYDRRSRKWKLLSSKSLASNVQLFEELAINLNTGTVSIHSRFVGINHHKLKIIDSI